MDATGWGSSNEKGRGQSLVEEGGHQMGAPTATATVKKKKKKRKKKRKNRTKLSTDSN